MSQLSDSKSEILKEIQELIENIRVKLNKSYLLKANKKLTSLPQPKGLVGGQLKDYQLQSLAWMVQLANNNLSGILADDMGLGKTIQTIAYLTYVDDVKGVRGKHLIVVPKNVLNNWKRQLSKWNPKFDVVILPGTQFQRQQILNKYIKPSKFDILIATFQSVQVCQNNLKKFNFQTLIIDQAHSIKNDQACLSACLRRLKFKFSLLLTGTPLSNQLKQLWSLLNFIVPDLFHDGQLFRKIQDSVNLNCKDEQQKIKFQSQIAGKFKAIISPFLLRRVKSQINLGLKQKKQFTLFVSLTELQLKMYRNYLKYRSVYGDQSRISNGPQAQLRKICCHPYLFPQIQDPKAPPQGQHLIQNCGKLKLLDKLLKKLLKQNHKILIFSQFVILLKILEDYCIYRKYKYSLITGQTNLQERDKAVQTFSKQSDTNIFLISTRAGGLGLNLVAADVVIIYDIDWNPQIDKQATDRAYRIGQTKNVMVFKIITNNTIQQRMLQVQKYKLIWDQLVIQKGGLARIKLAEQKFQKIDHNHIAGLGTQQIFNLQQNFDQKTIEQIIKIGQQKDKQKTDQIKSKLQKQLLTYGDVVNPFEIFQKQKSGLDQEIEYQVQKVGFLKVNKNQKLNWKERQNKKQALQNSYKQPKQFHLFVDKKQAGRLLYELQKQNLDEQIKKQYIQKLNQLGFYSWSLNQFNLFLEANNIHPKTEYEKISKHIKTKSIKQVKKYSQKFYEYLSEPGMKKYKKLIKIQEQLEKNIKMKSLQEQICAFPGKIFNLKFRSKVQGMGIDSLTRLYYNGMRNKQNVLEKYKEVFMNILPGSFPKIKNTFQKNHYTLIAYTKLTKQLQQKSKQQWQKLLTQRYNNLQKIYSNNQNQKIDIYQPQEKVEKQQKKQQKQDNKVKKNNNKSKPKKKTTNHQKQIQTNQQDSQASKKTALKV